MGLKPEENEREGSSGVILCPFQKKTQYQKCRNSRFLSQKMNSIMPTCLFRFMKAKGNWSLNLYIPAVFKMQPTG